MVKKLVSYDSDTGELSTDVEADLAQRFGEKLSKADADATYAPVPHRTAVDFELLPRFVDARTEANAVTFNRSNVVTDEDGTMYAAWWSDNSQPVIGKRTPTGEWSVFDFGDLPGTPLGSTIPDDGHNNFALVLDTDGHIHLWGNHHNSPLRYVRSAARRDITAWTAPGMVGTDEDSITYPQAVRVGDELLFFYRNGMSGNGDLFLNRWTGSGWERMSSPLRGAGVTPAQSPYICTPAVGEDGSLHIFSVWRVSEDYGQTDGIDHMVSYDAGETWQSMDGTPLTIPAVPTGSTGGTGSVMPRVVEQPRGYGLINQTGAAVDSSGCPHAAWWLFKTEDNASGVLELHHIWWDGDEWRNDVVAEMSGQPGPILGTPRPHVVCPPEGGAFIMWRNARAGDGLHLIDVSGDLGSFSVFNGDLGGFEPNYDVDAVREHGILRVLVCPQYRDTVNGVGDERWNTMWGGILTVDLAQIKPIAAGHVGVPTISTVTSSASAPGTINTDETLKERNLPPALSGGASTDLLLARLRVAGTSTSSPGRIALHQKAGNSWTGFDLARMTVPQGTRQVVSTPWMPVHPGTQNLESSGVSLSLRSATAASPATLVLAGSVIDVARIQVGGRPVRHPAPRQFSPANLGRWLMGWRVSSLGLSSGDGVDTLPDQSGNGRDLVQASSSFRPLFRPTGLNGHPGLEFDGVDDYLATAAGLRVGDSYTIMVVASCSTDSSGAQSILSADESGTAGRRVYQLRYNTGATVLEGLSFNTGSSVRQITSPTLSPGAGTARILTLKRTSRSGNNVRFELWANGVLLASSYTAHAYGNDASVKTVMGARIYQDGGSRVDFAKAIIGDGDIWGSWLSTQAQRAAEQRLAEQYGIALP